MFFLFPELEKIDVRVEHSLAQKGALPSMLALDVRLNS